jgi:hypothetical protein
MMMMPPVDERQRRVFYGVFGMLMFVLILMFLSQGRRSGRHHPEDLDLSFKYDEKEKALTLHFFKTPVDDEGEELKKAFSSRFTRSDGLEEAERAEGQQHTPRAGARTSLSLADGLFKRLSSKHL